MLTDTLISLFQYFNAWLLIASVLVIAVVSEKLYSILLSTFYKKTGRSENVSVNFLKMFRTPVVIPQSARRSAALYSPVMALAALMTVCACLPICTYIPLIDNGADIVQILLFMLLSEIFVITSFYSLGSDRALDVARIHMRGMLSLFFPLMAACSSIAVYLIKNGLETDPFSFNSFSLFTTMRSMSWHGIAGVLLFAMLILSQVQQKEMRFGALLLRDDELSEYGGAPRGLLQIWSIIRSFIAIAIVVYIIFPSDLITMFGESAAVSWGGQAVNFMIFWLSVVVTRLCYVPISCALLSIAEHCVPRFMRGGVTYILTVIAILLLWYEGLLLSMEAAAF